ncbi:MAG: 16S rRNA (adenine(1518)-N(6)/adenine(1519)-N(6))-dimethyltransferase RsmA [Synergistaceae bacterium]|jgi:16S rRNA (adenine1518-N6/adenine1519-N6)-dimethyltransferase|nr:16S rRNA (adenine(1518)-N(6)/adenine(1519)-N(6))-dimethyltransferase RsmA [Synergistaceae bacterium]
MTFRHNTDIGQNFLKDLSVADWMVKRASLGAADVVLEIGPGSGSLTKRILQENCARLHAIELDRRLAPDLDPIASSDRRLSLHWGDAVKFDYSLLESAPTHVVANLPYHITTPLIWRLLELYSGSGMSYMLIMAQAEAADRMTCGAGSRASNPLSITIEAVADAHTLRRVPRSAFFPMPRVDSAIVEIKFSRDRGALSNLPRDEKWRRLLSGSFAARRKTLANNWGGSFRASREMCAEILSSHSLKPLSRPEELASGDWIALHEAGALSKMEGRKNGRDPLRGL